MIIDAKTGFLVTKTGRKDLAIAQDPEIGVHGVFNNWKKLLELNKVKGIKREIEEAQATSQRLVREELERRKIKIEKMKEDGLHVSNLHVGAEIN